MNIKKKFLYSIIPTFVIGLTAVHLLKPGGIFDLSYFLALNAMILVQVVFLYTEMKKNNIAKSNRLLYTLLLLGFLPFHYILVWGLFDKKS